MAVLCIRDKVQVNFCNDRQQTSITSLCKPLSILSVFFQQEILLWNNSIVRCSLIFSNRLRFVTHLSFFFIKTKVVSLTRQLINFYPITYENFYSVISKEINIELFTVTDLTAVTRTVLICSESNGSSLHANKSP